MVSLAVIGGLTLAASIVRLRPGRRESVERVLVLGEGALFRRVRHLVVQDRRFRLVGAAAMSQLLRSEAGGQNLAHIAARTQPNRLVLATQAPSLAQHPGFAHTRLPLPVGCEVESGLSFYCRLRGKLPPLAQVDRRTQLPLVDERGDAPARVLSFALALVAITIALPLMLLIAATVKLDSRGPVLFVQRRAGRNGTPL